VLPLQERDVSAAELCVPEITPDMDMLTAALAYANAGWYVLPAKRGTKHPGSVVGNDWQRKSSRDPKQIAAWFAGTDHDIALHCGRSGAVVFDVDDPDKLPDVLRKHLDAAPFQSTRPDTPGRGHYLFLQPPGRTIGNGTGRLGPAWGEVRGLNGVIIAAPSFHAEGGEYRWAPMNRPVPVLPNELAELLDDTTPAEDAATDAQVAKFLKTHKGAERPGILAGWVTALQQHFETGSRHNGAVSVTTGAAKEARAGYFPAQVAFDTLRPMFITTATRPPTGNEHQRTEAEAIGEWNSIIAWAVAQANAADLDEVRARVDDKMPNNTEWENNTGAKPGNERASEFVDGADLLDDIDHFLGRFVVYPSEHARRAHVLWIAHTWLMDCWDSTPRIAFLSPEPGSGKSRALEVTEPLVPRPVHAVNTTPAYLFRKVADPEGKPTILYDEIDTVFGPKAKENEDIRGMLNAGHRKGAVAGRCVVRGKIIETEELDAYCAVMLAGLDDLPDTLMSRSVVVRMHRRAPSEPVEPWRPRVNEREAHALRARIATWAESVKHAAADMWPEMPPGVEDRNADVWEALLAVAELAGGHWPETARVAAVTDVTASKAGTPSIGLQLLQDIRTAFDTLRADRLSTESLLTKLKGMEESPWAVIRRGEPLDARGLAQRLRKYHIKPDLQRMGDATSRGYTRAQFTDAWSRYLSTESVTSVTPDGDSDIPPSSQSGGDALFDDPPCTVCTQPMLAPVSIERGVCEGCWLTTKRADQANPTNDEDAI
jgi:hypothetical protein